MKRLFERLGEAALLMVGQSSYDAYLRHMTSHHPGQKPMTRIAFFREREQARYGGRSGGRCC